MPLEVGHEGDRVTLRGELRRFDELRVVRAAVFDTIERGEHQQVTLDFAQCQALTPAAMLPLLPVVAGYRETAGASFELVEPQDDALKQQLIASNWAHFINPERYPLQPLADARPPARRFTAAAEIAPIVDDALAAAMSQPGVERADGAALEWAIYELADNVLRHAESPTGGFAQTTLNQESKRVELVIADGGGGLAGSMRIRDHEQALVRAVARDGLLGSFRIAKLSGGEFELNSGFALLHASRSGPDEYKTRKRRIRYSGTVVRCEIAVDHPDLLARALSFPKRSHKPRPDNEAATATLSIATEAAQEIGSRSGGQRVRGTVEQHLRENRSVTLDFSDIQMVSSGFADELLGSLFIELGPRAFMSWIQVRGANPVIDGLIDRAIMRRVRGE